MKLLTKRSAEILGFLDEGTTMTGELHYNGKLRIDGNFNGTIFTDDKLVIGKHAIVRAEIKAGEIEVAGEVIGNIEVQRRAEILPGGRVQGDIQAPVLSVSPGSILDGRMSIPGPATIGS